MASDRKGKALSLGYAISFEVSRNGPVNASLTIGPEDTPEMVQEGQRLLSRTALELAHRSPDRLAQDQGISHIHPSVEDGLTLANAVREFLAAADLKPSTLKNYKSYLENKAIPFFGSDRRVCSIQQSDFAAYIDHLKTLGRSSSTLEGYVGALSAMATWHRARGKSIVQWQSRTLMPANTTPEDQQRAEHSIDDLKVIFSNAVRYLKNEPEKFWVTVVTAFTGCRVEEIAQVDLTSDFHQHPSGIYYLMLNEKPDKDGVLRKTMKQLSSWRHVPIHTSLVDAGFVTFLRDVLAQGYVRPFERLWGYREMPLAIEDREDEKLSKWAHEISKWGGKEFTRLVESGVLSKASGQSYFHSMRHSLSSELGRRDVSLEHRSILAGQSVGGENGKRYAKLRRDTAFLSRIVEENLHVYVDCLNHAMAGETA